MLRYASVQQKIDYDRATVYRGKNTELVSDSQAIEQWRIQGAIVRPPSPLGPTVKFLDNFCTV